MFCILSEAELVMLNNLEVRRPHPAPPAPPAGANRNCHSQVHPLLLAERAETCTVWLLRYTLHVTSAPPHPAHKGKEDFTCAEGEAVVSIGRNRK